MCWIDREHVYHSDPLLCDTLTLCTGGAYSQPLLLRKEEIMLLEPRL